MNHLIRLALRHRALVVALAAFCLVYGVVAIRSIPVDVFPDLNRPVVTILTECEGMAPEEVETLVTQPLERSLRGIPGIVRIRSSCGASLSIIWADFDWGTDIYRNRQLVSERLNRAQDQIPESVRPSIGPVTSLLGEIQFVGLTAEEGKEVSSLDLRTAADWIVRPRLQAIPGVAQVMLIGGDVRQYQILISLEKIKYYQLTLEEVQSSLEHLSQNTTGGFINKGGKEYLLRNIGAVRSIGDIENSMVGFHLGRPILVKDIAEVTQGARLNKRGEASVNAQPSVLLSVIKQPDVSTIRLSAEVDAAMVDLQDTLPEGMVVNKDLFKQANFIQHSIHNVQEVLRDGIILVSLVLLLFLLNFRTTVISLTAIPLSFVLTFIVFKFWGLTINTMTLGGLAIAIGELVDDAIVDVENVFRRLRENKQSRSPESSLKVVYEASAEIRGSIVFATIIVVLVFFPLFQLGGLEGRLFIPLGIAYIVSLTASLLVSLTVTPVLCSYLLPNSSAVEKEPGILIRTLQGAQQFLLRGAFRYSKTSFSFTIAIFALAVFTLTQIGTSFLPPFQEGTAMISVVARPGISLETSNEIGLRAERLILEVPEVLYTSRKTGRSEGDEHAEGVHISEIDVDFKEGGRPRFEVLKEIRQALEAEFPDAFLNIGQPISHKIDHMMSGISSQVAIKIFGPDLGVLRRKASQVYRAIQDVEGLVDIQVERQTRVPQSKIHLIRQDAALNGIIAGNLISSLETVLNGQVVAQVLDDQRYTDVVIRLDEKSRNDFDALADVTVRIKPDGTRVPLSAIADLYNSKGPNVIQREDGRRRIIIAANIADRDIGSIMEEIDQKITQGVDFPTGYTVEYDGQYKSQLEASRSILTLSVLSLILIFAVLYAHFKSAWLAFQVIITLPLAVMGGIFAIYLMDLELSIATLIGFTTLCGIASRNAIMMISHFLHLMREEGEYFSEDMVLRGAKERLVPVLMTSVTAILGLIPLALSADDPGKEILHPLSIAIIGGLLTSTLFDIVITPTIFYKFGSGPAETALNPEEEL